MFDHAAQRPNTSFTWRRSDAPACDFDAPKRVFPAQSTLYLDFDRADWVFEIHSGVVKCYRVAPDGRCLIERFVGPGALLGLGVKTEYGGAAEALTEVEATIHNRRELKRRAARDQRLARRLESALIDQLSDARDQMLTLSCLSTEQRVAWFLNYLGERFEPDAEGYLPTPMSRRDIADFLGLALETVSRTLSSFRRNGLIDMPHPHRIKLRAANALGEMGALRAA